MNTGSDDLFRPEVAYFSMEMALQDAIPTYSGGLGVLAGDTMKAAADLNVRTVGVTLVHRKGYFRQTLDHDGNQQEHAVKWQPSDLLELTSARAVVSIEGRNVHVGAWRWWITGVGGFRVPVLLLDTDLPENSEWDRHLTDQLYGGDDHYRLCQEAVLGLGGIGILESSGYQSIKSFHMNEGHSALLSLALLQRELGRSDLGSATGSDIEAVRRQCVFTTHTPVPAGHDHFSRDLMRQVLGPERAAVLEVTHCCPDHALNMTFLALRFSRYVNGVAMHHGDISQGMFPRYPIHAITNGVHGSTWTSKPFRSLYDRQLPDWRRDNLYLRYAIKIPLEEIRRCHLESKRLLLDEVARRTGKTLHEEVFTIGFARRAAAYKRPLLLLSNPDRLRWIAEHVGPLQIIYGGKAHPRDQEGKRLIREICETADKHHGAVSIVFLEDYDLQLGALMTSGVDLWLNTPQRPNEASGTSGMKAALNGVPSLSVLDGWWIEGCLEGTTGWAIGHGDGAEESEAEEATSLHDKLEQTIIPLYYQRPGAYAEVMRTAISINGGFFNTHRMLSQYVTQAYAQSS
jgi:starch phosphorylase